MALIDEYKQAIQDVLDGRAKEAPRPSELPWTEDKAATMWAAAAAELIAEANSGGSSGGGALVVHGDENGVLDKTWKEISDAGFSVILLPIDAHNVISCIYIGAYNSNGSYTVKFAKSYTTSGSGTTKVEFELVKFATNSEDGYPVYTR